MSILPVLDLLHGQIVRGIAGRRSEYRPLVSRLVETAEPLAVARALRTHFGFADFYVADLDAIQRGQPNIALFRQLRQDGFRLWLDAGLQTSRDRILPSLLEEDLPGIIIGLESVAGPIELAQLVKRIGPERAVFSLDMQAGRPMGALHLWGTEDAWLLAQHAIAEAGVRRLIVLDLAGVGVGAGVSTESLCMRLKQTYSHVQLTTGGGVRGIEDVRRLEGQGIDYVLVASALHDGRITLAELRP